MLVFYASPTVSGAGFEPDNTCPPQQTRNHSHWKQPLGSDQHLPAPDIGVHTPGAALGFQCIQDDRQTVTPAATGCEVGVQVGQCERHDGSRQYLRHGRLTMGTTAREVVD